MVPEHDTARWPIVQQVYGHYMVPWDDRRVAVGATVEDAGFAPDVTAGGLREITTVWPYVLRYRVEQDRVIILRVRHGARVEED